MSKLVEFGHVFGSCLKLGEESALQDQEELARLQAENRTLRQLLKIAAPNDVQAAKAFAQYARAQRSQQQSTESKSMDRSFSGSEGNNSASNSIKSNTNL